MHWPRLFGLLNVLLLWLWHWARLSMQMTSGRGRETLATRTHFPFQQGQADLTRIMVPSPRATAGRWLWNMAQKMGQK